MTSCDPPFRRHNIIFTHVVTVIELIISDCFYFGGVMYFISSAGSFKSSVVSYLLMEGPNALPDLCTVGTNFLSASDHMQVQSIVRH